MMCMAYSMAVNKMLEVHILQCGVLIKVNCCMHYNVRYNEQYTVWMHKTYDIGERLIRHTHYATLSYTLYYAAIGSFIVLNHLFAVTTHSSSAASICSNVDCISALLNFFRSAILYMVYVHELVYYHYTLDIKETSRYPAVSVC